MGSEYSFPLELPASFDVDEVQRMHRMFRKIDLDNAETITMDEILAIPVLQKNPVVQRVFDIVDADGDGEVDFNEFLQALSVFGVKADEQTKLKFAFRFFDIDNDGFISNGEVFQVIKMITGNLLSDVKLQQMVDRTIMYADKDENGKISFEEFSKFLENAMYKGQEMNTP